MKKSALVNYSNQQMFALVNDIESYPEFMTGCIAAEVLARDKSEIKARLVLGNQMFQQSFVTLNELQPPKKMCMHLVEGPFSHFEGAWEFGFLRDGACKVSLDLEFDFKNPILSLTLGKKIELAANQQLDALCQRAEAIYGR